MENIVLIGFMGTGKSTVSKELSKRHQLEVIEMDQQIIAQEGMSISEIFKQHGEAYFRDLETELLVQQQKKRNVIISCGGGVPLRERNVVEMKKIGKIILLTARPESIWERVKENKERPLLNGNMNIEYIRNMMEQRKEKYMAAADFVVDTDGKSIEEICGEITERMEEKDASNILSR